MKRETANTETPARDAEVAWVWAQVVEMAERLDADACPGGFPVAAGEAAEGDVPAT
jgi:hypothetical protein